MRQLLYFLLLLFITINHNANAQAIGGGGGIPSVVYLGTSVTKPSPSASASDTTTGLYATTAGIVNVASAGLQALTINPTYMEFGNNTWANPLFYLNGAATGEKGIGIQSAGSTRWRIFATGAETGNNAGNNLLSQAFSDTGTQISGVGFNFNRASGGMANNSITNPVSTATSSFHLNSYSSPPSANEFGLTVSTVDLTGFGDKWAAQISSNNTGYITGASFTATISGTTLTVTGTPTGTVAPGMWLAGTGVTPGTIINAPLTGAGGAGTYSLSISQTVSSSETMTTSNIPTAWVTGTPYTNGEIALVGYNIIQATSTGTSGVTTPTCSVSVSTCSDGTVSWVFLYHVGDAGYQPSGLFISSALSANMGGTATGLIGTVFTINLQCNDSATYTTGDTCQETDVGLEAASPYRLGEQISSGAAGTYQGYVDDVAWRIVDQSSQAPFKALMQWGARTTGTPIDPNGYGLRVWSSGWNLGNGPQFFNAAGALDFEEFAPTGNGYFGSGFIFRGPGSQILGSGDIQSNYALLHKTTTGASLDVSQYVVTSVSLAAGGGGQNWAFQGWLADCNDGTVVRIQTVSGGAVTAVYSTPFYAAYSNAPISQVTCYSEQMIGPVDGTGNATLPSTTADPTVQSPILVNETWALANSGSPVLSLGGTASAVTIEPSGGNVAIGTTVTTAGEFTLKNASAHAGQATCWTTGGAIGYCTTVVSSGGACTCTGL